MKYIQTYIHVYILYSIYLNTVIEHSPSAIELHQLPLVGKDANYSLLVSASICRSVGVNLINRKPLVNVLPQLLRKLCNDSSL